MQTRNIRKDVVHKTKRLGRILAVILLCAEVDDAGWQIGSY